MPSQVDVYNLVAARIGVFDAPILAVTEASKIAQLCTMFYASMVDYVLAEFPWKFAERRVALASLGTPPTNWAYRYAYPSDCVTARYITLPGSRNPRATQQIPFQIGSDGTSREIYTDMPDAELVYTARITDMNLWGPIAVSALAYRLAAEVAIPMSGKGDLANAAMSGYLREVSRAEAAALNEGTPDQPPESELLTIRGGSDTMAFNPWNLP